MSHQTGINSSEELKTFLGKCKDGRIRVFKVGIEDEQLTLQGFKEPRGSWEEDYESFVCQFIEERQPCYLFYRLDSQMDTGCDWVLISWSPDNSPVREKMLYASTKASLKKEFGGSYIKYELFATTKEDASLHGYHKYLRAEKGPAPLTPAEEELQSIKRNESGVDIGIDTKHQTLQGVAFPISDEATSALFDMKEGLVSYVQLSIDINKEEINLEVKDHTDVHQLTEKIPVDHARYHLFVFPHSHEGDFLQSVVFIYSMPGYNCSVKERMLYSSCKNPLLEYVEDKIGVLIAKKLEVDDPKEITEEFLYDEIHPKKNIYRQKFAKPKGPGNRGARRLIRSKNDDEHQEDSS
ncbi:twinfilin-1-like isoform X1 [Tachypleus tridentatus]|uniref:twinfilin-1-like isoform X1 n=1 Tax=Tachypleus tridentatus TaxID=6853 RepID=UPI003FD40962